MDPLLLPVDVWKDTLVACDPGADEDCEEEDGKKAGETDAVEQLF